MKNARYRKNNNNPNVKAWEPFPYTHYRLFFLKPTNFDIHSFLSSEKSNPKR